ncbi:MAG: DUF1566 domain-containing protein [Syntrophales bacterium]
MKKILPMTIIGLLIAANSWAVVVTGSGTTKEDAINNGLREAVEMYTGALVYGVTDVENYQVQKDKIVAASLGYVKYYRIVKTSKIDNLIMITLDVTLSEDKIKGILRDNVKLITYEDVLKDYNNVAQRQDQIKKFAEMVRILDSRPVSEKYNLIYEGYEIKRIGATQVDVILNTRVRVNPFYSRAYNEILKNLSEGADSAESTTFGGNYRIENGKLVNSRYYISKDASVPYVDDVQAQVSVNGVPVDTCREYRDNLMVSYSPTEFVKAFATQFPKVFMQNWRGEDSKVDSKWTNTGIKDSKILPPEGLPLKVKYRISDSKEIKTLWNLKLTMVECDPDKLKSAQSKPIAENTQTAKEEEAMPSRLNIQEIKRDGQFIAYDNWTVLDNKTGLMWAAIDNGSDIDWQSAKTYCDNYRGGGYTDWRLPTQNELEGLYDKSKSYKVKPARMNVLDVHLTELIQLSAWRSWASDSKYGRADYFNFAWGIQRQSTPPAELENHRALPVRTAK